MTARWYVVNVYSGSEKKAAESIREQSVLKKMEDKILEVLLSIFWLEKRGNEQCD